MEEILKAMFLGITQGFTEFLPISSTGHLVLGRKYLGMEEAGLFLDTMLHLGTLLAVAAVFWDDLLGLVRNPFGKLSLLIMVGTIPTAVIGLAFEDYFENISKTGETLGFEFMITGWILWVADSVKKSGNKTISGVTYTDAIIVGTLQGAAIFPAISRSGLTIAGSLLRGMEKGDAARFSFLLSLPAILGACVLQGRKLIEGQVELIGLFPLALGTLAAALSGYIAVRWMLRIIQTGTLKWFSIYVWALGGVILLLQIAGKW